MTNLPDLTFAQAHILARTRWQIEMLFKLWKSHGKVLISRSADPIRQQCEGYGKLLGVLIAHWLLLVAGWQPQRLGALDALRILRTHITLFHQALARRSRFHSFFRNLTDELALASPRSKRGKNPLAFQLWAIFLPLNLLHMGRDLSRPPYFSQTLLTPLRSMRPKTQCV